MDEQKSSVVRGIPTAPAVRSIMEKFPDPEPGTVIEYGDLEALIGFRKGTSRFQTVVNAWRRAMFRDFNIVLDCVPNTGYQVQDGKGRVVYASRKYTGGIRRIAYSGRVAATTDAADLDEKELRLRDRLVSNAAVLEMKRLEDSKRYRPALPSKN